MLHDLDKRPGHLGPQLDGKSLYELFEAERVTVSAGVPTVWQGLLGHVETNGLQFSSMRRTVIGGSACPPAMTRLFQDRYGVQVLHAWGMTEMSPLGTVCSFLPKHVDLDQERKLAVQAKQGRVVFGVDMKIVGDDGGDLPWDGKAFGDLLVRGPWVLGAYFKGDGGSPLQTDENGQGWFPTGDVATIDADGYMHITDRSKDVIKSGGAAHEPEQVGIGVVAHQRHVHALAPVRPAVGAEPPRVGLVFQVGERLLDLRRETGFHEHLVLARLDDEIQMFDVHRADVLTGPAGGAGPEHVAGDRGVVTDDGFDLVEIATQNGVGLVRAGPP